MQCAAFFVVAVIATAACDADPQLSVVVITRQNEWVHPSNPVAAAAIQRLGAMHHWSVLVSDDPAVLTTERLARTDVVIFSVTSANILDAAARANLEAYFAGGGGFVGIHSASYTEWAWPFYLANVVPVTFKTHPAPVNVQPGRITIDTRTQITIGLPDPWIHDDEFYTFNQRPEQIPGLEMLISLDESSLGVDYNAPKIGYHPLAFAHELSGGRTFYTALGHTPESYAEPAFLGMLERGIWWAGGIDVLQLGPR
jgi:type 1 glutamine amidotransferase